jgi:deglycase
MDLEGALVTLDARIEPAPHDVPHGSKDLPPRARRRRCHGAGRLHRVHRGRPAPAASGPGRSRAALDRMHERMAGYVEHGRSPASSRWSPRADDVHLDIVGTCTLAFGTSTPVRRALQPEDRSRRRITWNRVEDGVKIAVLVADAFQDSEYFLPKIEIEKLGVETEVISLKREPVEIYSFFARIGLLDVQKTIREADPSDYAGVLVPGGAKSPAILSESEEVLSFVREIDAEGKLVAPICRGSLLVANSGIVKGRRMTGFHMGEQWPELVVRPTIEKFGGIWVGDQPVVVDGNLISSRHPDDVAHFIGAIRDWLQNAPKLQRTPAKGPHEPASINEEQ